MARPTVHHGLAPGHLGLADGGIGVGVGADGGAGVGAELCAEVVQRKVLRWC